MNNQLEHENYKHDKIKYPLTIILNNVDDPSNVGGIFRIADALGFEKVIMCGSTVNTDNKNVKKVSRSTIKYVDNIICDDIHNCIEELKQQNYTIVALEITDSSISLDNFQVPASKKVAIIVGNEKYGVEESVLKLADFTVHIDMNGVNSSMNVAVATGICGYQIIKLLK
ncbi:MAG: TrmH family RNA methyltransferase [Bacilli bacterium]|nr:TrmH family RNA methyltransferase [Bacilli bacterium]